MGLFHRREFLQQSAIISAALAASRPLFGESPKPSTATRTVGPNDTLRVAVVGVRGRGMSHVHGFGGIPGCEVVTICDCDEAVIGNAMKTVEKKTGKAPKFEKDIRKVVEDKSIDIVSIATPNHWHALAAIWALQNDKDVYVEKPVSHNVWEGRQIVEWARKRNRICQAGTQSRSMPGMRDSIAYIHDGKIGKVKLAYGTCYKRRGSIGKVAGPQDPPKSIDYDLWCGPAAKLPIQRKSLHYDWHWIWAYGNGDLGNQGIHEMDKARWGLGKTGLPKSVISIGGRFGYVDDGQTANTQLCVFDYGDSELIFDVRGLASDNPFPGGIGSKKKGDNFVGNIFYGSEGIVVCPSYSSGVVLDKELKVVKQFGGGGSEGIHFDNFVKSVRNRKAGDLNGDILEGHLSSALCHLGNISYQLGIEKPMGEVKEFTDHKDAQDAFTRMTAHLKDNNVELAKAIGRVGPLLQIDSQAEKFVGPVSDKANPLLTAEYRKGFEVTAPTV